MNDVEFSIAASWSVLRDAYIDHLRDCVIKKMMEEPDLSFEDARDVCIDELDEDLHTYVPYDLSYDDVEDILNELGYVAKTEDEDDD